MAAGCKGLEKALKLLRSRPQSCLEASSVQDLPRSWSGGQTWGWRGDGGQTNLLQSLCSQPGRPSASLGWALPEMEVIEPSSLDCSWDCPGKWTLLSVIRLGQEPSFSAGGELVPYPTMGHTDGRGVHGWGRQTTCSPAQSPLPWDLGWELSGWEARIGPAPPSCPARGPTRSAAPTPLCCRHVRLQLPT